MVQSICLTSRGSGVRFPQLPQTKRLAKLRVFFYCISVLCLPWSGCTHKKLCPHRSISHPAPSLELFRFTTLLTIQVLFPSHLPLKEMDHSHQAAVRASMQPACLAARTPIRNWYRLNGQIVSKLCKSILKRCKRKPWKPESLLLKGQITSYIKIQSTQHLTIATALYTPISLVPVPYPIRNHLH